MSAIMQFMVIHAIYENGVFRPKQRVDLPEHCEVRFEPLRVGSEERAEASSDEVMTVLSKRFRSGHRDTAARHNEHQP